MELHYFHDNSFVMRGLLGVIRSAKVSAWFTPEGELATAEYFTASGRTYPVTPRMTNVIATLNRTGKARRKGGTAWPTTAN